MPSSRSRLAVQSLAALGLVALLPACVVGERASGVLPTEAVAPPPFMRPAAQAEAREPARPARREVARRERLERPDGSRIGGQETGARRIRREDIEGEDPRSGGGSSVGPVIGSGGIGLGGKF